MSDADWTRTTRAIGAADPTCLHCMLRRFTIVWFKMNRKPDTDGKVPVDSDHAIEQLCAVIADFVNSAPGPAREHSAAYAIGMLAHMIEARRDRGGVGEEVRPMTAARH